MSRSRPLVLNVDDNSASRYARGRILEQAGFEVIEATDADQVLELAARLDPDVILLDVQLPGQNGFAVGRRLRALETTASTPVLHITAWPLPDSETLGIASGSDDFLFEPVDPGILVAKVRHFAGVRENIRQLAAEAARRRQSEQRLQAIFEASPVPLLVYAADGQVLAVSESWTEATGYSVHGIGLLHEWVRKVCEGDEYGAAALQDCLLGTQSRVRNVECRFRVAAGQRCWFLVSVSSLGFLEDGREFRAASVIDFTERKMAEQAIAASREEYRAMSEALPYGIWRAAPDGGLLYASPSFLELLQMTEEEARGFGWMRRLPPEDAQPTLERWLDCVLTGEPWEAEHRIVGPDGNCHYVLSRGRPVRNCEGQITCWVGIHLDIDERKVINNALLRSEREFRAIFEMAGAGAMIVDNETTRIVRVNPRLCQMLGYSAEELLQMRPMDITHPDDRVLTQELSARFLSGELKEFSVERRHIRKDGSILWGLLTATVLDAGQHSLGITLDITRLKAAEEALRASEERYSTLASAVPGILFSNLADGACDYISPQWEQITGVPASEALDEGWLWVIHPEDRERCETRWQQSIETGLPFEMDYRVRTSSGEYRWFRSMSKPAQSLQGRIVKWFGVSIDVETLKRAEAALRDAERYESVGFLAAGVAHNLNNILVGVMGTASMLADEVPPKLKDSLDDIIRASHRAADLTSQLLAYAGKGKFVVRPADLSEVVGSTASLLESNIPRKISLRWDLAPVLPLVEVDKNQIRQVVLSLTMNAAEAIGSGPGAIVVRTTLTELDTARLAGLSAAAQMLPGKYVMLEVTDTGCGMDPHTINRIFEPFFTTKFTGRGLGLAALAGIVRGHGGGIEVESTLGRGSTFRVFLPAAIEKPVATRQPVSGTLVLIVDDEEVVLRMTKAALSRRGYSVIAVQSGTEALSVMQTRAAEIAVLILDLVMPNMDGVQTLRALRSLRPDLPVIVSSGYERSEVLREFGAELVDAFLAKPYTARQVADIVAEITGPPQRALPDDTPPE